MNTAREIRNIWDEIGRMKTRTAGSSSGADKTFLGLNDTPATYAGAPLQNVRVNAGANALEFAAGGGGDVTGPAGATDNAIARFDAATGKLIQNSNAILSDAGELSLGGALFIAEVATPVARPNYGAVYPKNDNILYFQDGAGIEHAVALGAGAGDVVGPGASTDNALARFHLATGKIIQNSNAILTDAGMLFLGDTANTKMTLGLTINQAGAADEILAFKSSDIAHGITDQTETDTYGFFRKGNATGGGLLIGGLTEDRFALFFQAFYTTDETTWTAVPALSLGAYKKSGTNVGNAHADQVLVAVRTYYGGGSTNVWGVRAKGQTWQTGQLYVNSVATPNDGQFFLQANGGGGLHGLVFTPDNIQLGFDLYWDGVAGRFKSLDAGSNFEFYKISDRLLIRYDSGIAVGSPVTMNTGISLDTSGHVGIGLLPTANMAGLSIEAGLLTLKERTTPTADAGYGKIYTKSDNALYFQDGAGAEHTVTIS